MDAWSAGVILEWLVAWASALTAADALANVSTLSKNILFLKLGSQATMMPTIPR